MLNASAEERLNTLRILLSPELHNVCAKCEGTFLARLRSRLTAPPQLSLEEQLEIVMEMLTSIAEDPMLVSMHQVEILHAQAKNSGVRSSIRRRKMPVTLTASQCLVRWQSLQASRIGDKKRVVDSVRKHIVKRRVAPLPREKCGHNCFLKENERRTDKHQQ